MSVGDLRRVVKVPIGKTDGVRSDLRPVTLESSLKARFPRQKPRESGNLWEVRLVPP